MTMTLYEWFMQQFLQLPRGWQSLCAGMLGVAGGCIYLLVHDWVKKAPMSWLDTDTDSCLLEMPDQPPPA